MLRATILAAFLVLAGVAAMAAAPFDEAFVRYEARGSAYELEFARLGQVRAIRSDVRAYAATLVNDHEVYNAALRDLAQLKDIEVPPGLDRKDQQRLDRLSAARGATFDAAFIREARRINSDEVRSFRREASRTTDPDIRDFVRHFLEVDEQHEVGARALAQRNVASQAPVIHPPKTGDSMTVIPPPSGSAMPVIPPPPPVSK
jgi:putative membrane protein